MPNTKSAIKRVKLIHARTLRNNAIKSRVKTAVRRFNEALSQGEVEQARQKLLSAIRVIDKAHTKGVLHRNTAARKKSKLQQKFNRIALLTQESA